MSKRTFITIAIAVAAAILIGTLWFVFFNKAGTQPSQTGSFGSGQDRPVTGDSGSNTATNLPGTIDTTGQNASAGAGTAAGSGSGTANGGFIINLPSVPTTSVPSAPGVTWLSSGTGGGSGTIFTPSAINQLNNGQVGGQVSVLGQFPGQDGGGSGGNNLGIAGIVGAAAGCLVFLVPGPGNVPQLTPPAVFVKNSANDNKGFLDCIARTIARAAIQQITASVVNWINSGFNGKPAFVQNYQQFFANVADQAAGEFIKNYTNFAPFCTPFRNQIQIALAQSYARRGNSAPACTLTQILGTNIFSGSKPGLGWSNFVSFTTNSSNNPFGAYMSAQVSLQGSIAQALTNSSRNISANGFLNFQEPYDCKLEDTGDFDSKGNPITKQNCKYKTSTPGSVLESSLNKTLGGSLDSLNLAKSFDEIIGALISQLMTKALYSGVSNLSGQNGYAGYYLTPDQQQAQAGGQQLLTALQQMVGVSQQYGQAIQGTIQDIQNAQTKLNDLANCWQTAASSTALTEQQQQIAYNNMQAALNQLHSYDAQIDALNAQITRANTVAALLQDLQTKTLNVTSTKDVNAIKAALDEASAQGKLLTPAELTQAQQDRSTLQSQLASVNDTTAANLRQCYDFR